jgi:hypothetical protein
MNRMKSLFRNITLLNIMLITVVIILGNYIVFPFLNINLKYVLPVVKKTIVVQEEKPSVSYNPSHTDYTMIAEENLFHPERKIPIEKKEEQPLPKPEFMLYGTLITDDTSLAYLEDLKAPYSTPGRGKRQTTLRKGDTMSGFTLKDVEADKIVMVRGEEKMLVYLIDPSHPKAREILSPGTQGAASHTGKTHPTYKEAKQQFESLLRPPPSSNTKYETLPPQSPEEQSVIEFFEKKRR